MNNQSFEPISDQSNGAPTPINWDNVTQLPPVTDTSQQSPTFCTEGMDISHSYETFTKNNNK